MTEDQREIREEKGAAVSLGGMCVCVCMREIMCAECQSGHRVETWKFLSQGRKECSEVWV